jgi:DNA-3-methyladenine glycosylase
MLDLEGDPVRAARRLVGWELVLNEVGGVIVEVEAYRPDDPASHAFRGQTPRNAAMFGPAGRFYVYRSYGIHWCMNIVCGPVGVGAGVLIRALEPTLGVETMVKRRGVPEVDRLCRGPGNVGRALGAGPELNGVVADLRAPLQRRKVATATRIGLSVGAERRWRFGDPASRSLSRPLR